MAPVCPYCRDGRIKKAPDVIREEIIGIRDGRPLSKRIEVYYCDRCDCFLDRRLLNGDSDSA